MKKIILVTICLLVIFCGCGDGSDSSSSSKNDQKEFFLQKGVPESCVEEYPQMEECLTEEAVQAGDIGKCDLIVYIFKGPTQTFEQAKEMFSSNVDACIIRVAESEKDVDLCDEVVKDSLFKTCVQTVAKASGDESDCQKIKERLPDASTLACEAVASS